MKISGFTFVRNTSQLFYPVLESIYSILDLVDEFVIAVGDSTDDTRELVASIKSDKIKIIDTVWDLPKFKRGEFAHQTDIAKALCTGDWLFYIQGDEVVHEKYLPIIKDACQKYLGDEKVEGFLFNYKHFWGDYNHYMISHAWYPKEIRIIRNRPHIHSWKDAQSFRSIPEFDGESYFAKEGSRKLNVIQLPVEMYHYGWVRPPHKMAQKNNSFHKTGQGQDDTQAMAYEFDYGPLNQYPVFKDTHPATMQSHIEKFDWQDQLRYEGSRDTNRAPYKHEKLKYRMLTWVEQNFLGGNLIGGFKNYNIIGKYK
ncbi:glycosyltransferase family 2 protein [Persicobacter psychrovividus]|uniref:Glycosyltransferase n=1 Tax=Persicobacter psychrovividus TaxID=387638 RepID=A0ABM7VAW4_9BACT|nr:hypothetical protein PEPS_03380 [Persicobacter psychrovividus]